MKTKIVLEQLNLSGKYLVKALTNRTTPKIDSELTKAEVEKFIANGETVEIKPYKRKK
jgi:hypothetical protein